MANLTTPFQIKIPLTIAGSSCRKTSGGCRYWDHKKNQWSTEGMFEKERTDTYILCEATHLSDFAVSADDIVPEFNLVGLLYELRIQLTHSLKAPGFNR